MNTPIYDYLLKYSESDTLRLHMPGHKGKKAGDLLSGLNPFDITEITGAGNLFEYDGIVAESEKNASELFGTKATYYSVQGSTLCIQTMLALMKYENRHVIAIRNAHRAFLSACVLLDLDVTWVFPYYKNSIISGTVSLNDVEKELRIHKNACLYVTSPDYFGAMADIRSLAELCHRNNAVLLVDNAHGACLPYYSENMHPIALGADMCCDSAHKMLPAFTGAAYLHIANEKYISGVKEKMTLFASTSPSYLIMCSLDLCNAYIAEKLRSALKKSERFIKALRESECMKRFEEEKPAFYREPLHFTINAESSGINGLELAAMLRENKAEYEYADDTHITMLFSPIDEQHTFLRLESILNSLKFNPHEQKNRKIHFPVPEKVMSVREAALSPYDEILTETAEGRICACVNVPCPPAVPIAVSGELISGDCIKIMKSYGINKIKVVK